jgi:hypothetical protein
MDVILFLQVPWALRQREGDLRQSPMPSHQ